MNRLLEELDPEQREINKRNLETADKAPLDTGVKVIRQMPNNEDSKKLAKRA